jgi:hypothetical protein
MAHSPLSTFRGAKRFASRRDEFGPGEVQPFGTKGVGALTGHPVGLVVIVGIIVITVAYVPAARWFFGGALLLGCIIGLLLWLRDR